MSVDHSKRLAAQDIRNEVRRMERHEAEVRRVAHGRWWKSIDPLLNTSSRPSDDFEGCTE